MSWPRTDSRRECLRGLLALGVGALAGPARALAGPSEDRRLSFLHTHTGERLEVEYAGDGANGPEALARVNRFLRDHRTGEVHPIDPALLDLLHDLRLATGTRAPFAVISGYRSPRTNAVLRARSLGVAGGSLHTRGQAIDIRLEDKGTAVLRDAALELRRGGVGYYAGPDFVHVDTGRVRAW